MEAFWYIAKEAGTLVAVYGGSLYTDEVYEVIRGGRYAARYLRGAVAIVILTRDDSRCVPFSNSEYVPLLLSLFLFRCWCPRWSKVSPDHILNESVLRSEDPLSTAVLLALSKTEPKGSQREKEGGGGGRRGGENVERSRRLWEGGRDVSRT